MVKAGDTLASVAKQFDVSLGTLAGLNGLSATDGLQIGKNLVVPGPPPAAHTPTPTGVPAATPRAQWYTVRSGDSIDRIAEQFGVTPSAFMALNHLTANSRLWASEDVLIPATSTLASTPTSEGGTPSGGEGVPHGAATMGGSSPWSTYATWTVADGVYGTGTFAWPVRGVLTQLFSWHHNGLDIANSTGTPLHAANSGQVIWAGWDTGGLGWSIKINHGHGWSTVYGHCSKLLVTVGQAVTKGQEIALMGATGNATGPHVHFMIEYENTPQNPQTYLP